MLRIPAGSSKTLCRCLKRNEKSLEATRNLHQLQSEHKIHVKSSKIIRNEFLNYFMNLDHKFVASSRVDPIFDPLVAFTNAGMNQFKPIFLGEVDAPFLRAVNHQKCIRVGGKHNDLDAVGRDTYHHTFFEMLGNWSFGDYRKRKACAYAWGLLTGPFGIPKDRLYVTYFKGDKSLNLPPDIECKEIWLSLGVPEDRILPFGAKENFWEMGPTGPCGLCTEIHISTSQNPGNQSALVNQGHSDLKELWNLVFIEFQRLEDGSVLPLESHHVDTGMGLERLVAVLQGKDSNYDTDLFSHIFEGIRRFSGANEYRGRVGDADDGVDTGYRILGDHARMISVCLADGMIPEENHRVRRVLRRAINVGVDVFKKEGILGEICAHVGESLGDVYPEVQEKLKHIQAIVNYEEDLLKALKKTSGKQWQELVASRPILRTISDPYISGLHQAYKELQKSLPSIKGPMFPGELAFKLYESHGLDLETIEELGRIEGLIFDKKDFDEHLAAAKMKSRVGSSQSVRGKINEKSLSTAKQLIEPTDDSFKYNYVFEGNQYKFPEVEAKILGIFVDGDLIQEETFILNKSLINKEIGLILDKTSFYTPGGGQPSDKGHLHFKNLIFKVSEVQKVQDHVIHLGNFDFTNFNEKNSLLSIGDSAKVFLDVDHRISLMRHHTATHLLNAALKKIFPAVSQRGSLVKNDCLIFQFSSYGKSISPENVKLIEKFVNDSIKEGAIVQTRIVDQLQFHSEKNLLLVPGAIYPRGDLRIVEIEGNDLTSKEACCGTHVHNISALNYFKIIEVTSKGSSTRTIKAVAGPQAEHLLPTVTENLSKISTEELKDTNKKKEMVEDFLKCEIKFAMEGKDNFVVHCLSSSLIEVESIPLQKANEYCWDKPILLISKSSRKVKARCFVPEEFISDEFNAKLWMEAVNKHLESKIGSFSDENPLLTSHTRVTKFKKDEIFDKVKKAAEEARNFASEKCKKL